MTFDSNSSHSQVDIGRRIHYSDESFCLQQLQTHHWRQQTAGATVLKYEYISLMATSRTMRCVFLTFLDFENVFKFVIRELLIVIHETEMVRTEWKQKASSVIHISEWKAMIDSYSCCGAPTNM